MIKILKIASIVKCIPEENLIENKFFKSKLTSVCNDKY